MQFIDCIERVGTSEFGTRPEIEDYSTTEDFVAAVLSNVEVRMVTIPEGTQEHVGVFVADSGVARGCYIGPAEMIRHIPGVVINALTTLSMNADRPAPGSTSACSARNLNCVLWDTGSASVMLTFNCSW